MPIRTARAEPSECFIAASTILLLHDALRPWRITLEALLDLVGLDQRGIEAPEMRISMEQSAALVRHARDLTKEPGIGIHLGLLSQANTFGFLSFASQSAATLGEAIDLTIRYAPLVTSGFGFRLNRVDGIAGLVVEELCDLGDARDVFLLGALIGLRTIGCELARREPWRPIDVAMPEPEYYRRFAHLVPELRFDQPVSQIVLVESDLEIPLRSPDRAALRLATERCEHGLLSVGADAPIERRTLKVLLKDDGPMPFDEVASALGVSPRSLKRRLADAGVTFVELVEKARCERALLLIRSPSLSLDDIAARLGYSNVSNLVRAFRRWTGTTPAAYRRGVVGRPAVHLPSWRDSARQMESSRPPRHEP